jgi:hypothetical protein
MARALGPETQNRRYAVSIDCVEPAIYLQYKNRNQMDSDALAAANYSSGLLSQIIPTVASAS